MYRMMMILLLLMLPGMMTAQQAYESLLKARAFIKSGKHDQAIELVTRTLAANETDSRLYIVRAEARLARGDYSGAILDFNIANKHQPYSGEFGLARIYSLKGDASTSVYHLERNLSSEFRKSEKEIMLDPSFGVIENRPEWRQLWKKEWYSFLDRSIADIEYNLSRGNVEEAKSLLKEIEASYGGDEIIPYIKALISYSSKNFTDAIKILAPFAGSDRADERSLRLYARAQEGMQNPAGASVTYSRLISMETEDAGLLLLRAECYMKTGETANARTDIERYLAIDPEDKTALSLAGRVEAASGDNIKALGYFSRNLELHPGDPALYIDRANSYFRSKSWKWAISDYSMSLDLKPDNAEAWLSKGLALLSSGKPQDACHDFRRSFSLGNRKAAEYISKNCLK